MSEIILDNSTLWQAAEALEREAAVLRANILLGEAPDALSCLEDSARQLRAIAAAAATGPLRVGKHEWPGVAIVVQGVSEPDERCHCCDARKAVRSGE